MNTEKRAGGAAPPLPRRVYLSLSLSAGSLSLPSPHSLPLTPFPSLPPVSELSTSRSLARSLAPSLVPHPFPPQVRGQPLPTTRGKRR
eukprot:scaffold25654_cov24-Tisochrysis_lutea.AAC.1